MEDREKIIPPAPVKRKNKNKNPAIAGIFFGLLFAGMFSAILYVSAVPPDSKYDFSETLSPSCQPGSTNCSVIPPATYSFGANNFSGTGGFTGGYLTIDTNTLYVDPDTNRIGIGTTSPTYSFSLGGDSSRVMWMERNSITEGSSFTLQAGGGLSGGTDLSGGALYLASGIATGSGSSDMFFQTATPGTSGTSDRVPSTKLTIRGNGSVIVGTAALATNATSGFLYIPTFAGTPTGNPVSETGTAPMGFDTTNHLLYVRDGASWKYFAETGGFQIPDYETSDPLSGEKMKEGDFVLGMIDKTLPNENMHGIWVKWSSVKDQFLAEARGELSNSGFIYSGSVSGVSNETFLEKVKNSLITLGISVKDDIVNISQLAVEKITAKSVKTENLEMVDKDTGEVYCAWIQNGELVKAKGECNSSEVVRSDPTTVGASTQEVQEIINNAQAVANEAVKASENAVYQAEKQIQEAKNSIKEEIKQELSVEENNTDQSNEEEPVEPIFDGSGEIIKNATSDLFRGMLEFVRYIFLKSSEYISFIIPDSIEKIFANIASKSSGAIKNAIEFDFDTIKIGTKSASDTLLDPLKKIR